MMSVERGAGIYVRACVQAAGRADPMERRDFPLIRRTALLPQNGEGSNSKALRPPRTRSDLIDPRPLPRDIQQGLRVRLVEADGGNLVPGEEGGLAQPFRVGRDFLQVEAVFLDIEQAA